MADVLDQSEIDALLSAVDGGEEEEQQQSAEIFSKRKIDPDTVEIRSYDFKRPERVSKDQMRAIQTLHEAFARNFGASLSGFLRTIVEVKVATCEQMTYGEFISGLPNPTSFNLINPNPLEGQICLEVSPLIIYPIIDRLLGGTSQDLFIPQRPMTQIETRLISSVTNRGLSALAEAWAGVCEMTLEIAATESNPQLVQIVPPNEVVIVVGLELKMSNRAGTMNLCIPYNVIEPVMDDLAAQSWFSSAKSQLNPAFRERLTGNVSRTKAAVTAVLADTTITLKELADMQPGDLLLTKKPSNEPIVLKVGDERKYIASFGQFEGRRAARVHRRYEPSDHI